MKYTLSLICLAFCLTSYSQERKYTFEHADEMIGQNHIIELTGNVDFKMGLLEVKKADKVIIDEKTNEVQVSGITEFTFDGVIHLSPHFNKKFLHYTLGNDIYNIDKVDRLTYHIFPNPSEPTRSPIPSFTPYSNPELK